MATTMNGSPTIGSDSMNVAETINEIHTWLHTVGIDLEDQYSFIDGYCCKLQELGFPLDRLFCGAGVMHPLVRARAWKWVDGTIKDFTWTRAEHSELEEREPLPTDPPVIQLMRGAPFVRIKLTDEVLPEDVNWMAEENYTELYGLPSPNTGESNLEGAFTWSTKRQGGFSDDHIAVINGTMLSLATALRFQIMKFTSRTLLMLYLGEDAGARVHRGEIERGEGLTIRSVIWFSDIRGFTKMSGELSRRELVDVINGVFEVTTEVIKEYKGQTLKFMGDGLMAIFSCPGRKFQRLSFSSEEKQDLDNSAGPFLCEQARSAAAEVQKRLAALKQEREEKGLRGASVGVGLHYGDVSYGNVGGPERLDFTVLGPHVNLASRTESLCSKLGAKVLCTADFVKIDGDLDAWESRGEHACKGVAEPVHIYELKSV